MKLAKAALVLLLPALLAACGPPRRDTIIVGSKNFTEQLILGEIMAQQIEAHTRLHVERRFYLWGTYICQQAMLAGHIDIYPEYTGTALTAILKLKPEGQSPAAVLARVRRAYARRFDFVVGAPFGFDDSFALVVRGSTARRLDLHTISDVVPYARDWRAGVGYEFMGRPDGYPLLERVYGLHFGSTRVMDLGLLYRALLDRQVNLVVGNSTDGVLAVRDFTVLSDDGRAFPPYEAVPIVRSQVFKRHPELRPVLNALAGKITAADMRRLNYEVEGEHRDVKQVVRQFLLAKHLIGPAPSPAPPGASAPTSHVKWKRVSSFRYDWDHHGVATFVLEIPSHGHGPGDFTRIRIHVPGRRPFVLTNPDGWVAYDSESASVSPGLVKSSRNLIPSDYVLAVKVARRRTLLLLTGFSYGCCFGSLYALEIGKPGSPRVVFHRGEFDLTDIRDFNGDGKAEMVGRPCLAEEWGNGLLTYDPFNVYKLGEATGSPMHLSLSLSKRYNLAHYYGWAGPKCSETIAVVLHPPKGGKPIVVSAKEAERMTENRR